MRAWSAGSIYLQAAAQRADSDSAASPLAAGHVAHQTLHSTSAASHVMELPEGEAAGSHTNFGIGRPNQGVAPAPPPPYAC